MKRDMDLVRSILLAIEADPKAHTKKIMIDGFDAKVIHHHLEMLEGEGLLDHPTTQLFPDSGKFDHGHGLTWTGHDFLDTIRDPEIWKQTKSGASKIGSWTVSLLLDLAKGYAKQKAISLGLPIT